MKYTPKIQPPELRMLEERIISMIKRKLTVPQIIEELKLPRHYVYRTLKRMEKEGIIIKEIRTKKGYVELDSRYHINPSPPQ